MSDETRNCLGCRQPVVEGRVKHSPGCKVATELREQHEAEATLEAILADKDKYQTFLTESIAKHLVRLHQLAMRGSHRAAQQFREGALDILELLNAEGEKQGGHAASVPGVEPEHKQGSARGRTPPTLQLVDGAPVGVAPGPRRRGKARDSDEGRTGSGDTDQGVPE